MTTNNNRATVPKATDFRVSSGYEQDEVSTQAISLIEDHGWVLCNDGKGLERSFKFKGFKSAWEFMNHIAAECKRQKHHPEWSNVYSKTHIRWTTHDPEGLSLKDTSMAKFCDEAGQTHGELEQSPDDEDDCGCGGPKKQ